MPEPITDDELREIREALGDQVPAIWMHRNAWAWLAALCDEVERLRDRIAVLADWHETKADKARRFPGAEVAIMEKAAGVHEDAARRLRTALDGE